MGAGLSTGKVKRIQYLPLQMNERVREDAADSNGKGETRRWGNSTRGVKLLDRNGRVMRPRSHFPS